MEITVEPYAVLQRQQKERLSCLLIEHPTDQSSISMGVIYHLGIYRVWCSRWHTVYAQRNTPVGDSICDFISLACSEVLRRGLPLVFH
jgi:hypothetical protein